MIFIINQIIISDMMITDIEINNSRYDLFLKGYYQMECAGWMKKGCFHSAMNN